jgi:hypothetical protein
MNTTQKIIALTRYLEQNSKSMTLKEAFQVENTLRELRKQLSREATYSFEELLSEVA